MEMDPTCGETENPEENMREDLIEMEDIQVFPSSFGDENSGEEPSKIATEVDEEIGRGGTQNGCLKRLQSRCQAVLIGILMVLFCGVTSVLLIQIIKQQNPTQMQMENNELKKLLKSTHQNVTTTSFITMLSAENTKLKLLLKNTLQEKTQMQMENNELKKLLNSTHQNVTTTQNITMLSAENNELKLLLKNTLQGKTQMQMENNELRKLLNSTHQIVTTAQFITMLSDENTQLKLLLENRLQGETLLQLEKDELHSYLNSSLGICDSAKEENRQLELILNQSLYIISLASAESRRWRVLSNEEQEFTRKLEATNQLQRSILFSAKLSFLRGFCSLDKLQCSRCMPDWVEHASRCFFLPKGTNKWEDARRKCLDMGGDLAVVLNAKDQAFLTNMTFQFGQQNPQERLQSAWIGLQDMVKEGDYVWVNGNRTQRDAIYWRQPKQNNTLASGDKDAAGQDCVAIVPPSRVGQTDWLKSWNDVVCSNKKHSLCETTVLSLS